MTIKAEDVRIGATLRVKPTVIIPPKPRKSGKGIITGHDSDKRLVRVKYLEGTEVWISYTRIQSIEE